MANWRWRTRATDDKSNREQGLQKTRATENNGDREQRLQKTKETENKGDGKRGIKSESLKPSLCVRLHQAKRPNENGNEDGAMHVQMRCRRVCLRGPG